MRRVFGFFLLISAVLTAVVVIAVRNIHRSELSISINQRQEKYHQRACSKCNILRINQGMPTVREFDYYRLKGACSQAFLLETGSVT